MKILKLNAFIRHCNNNGLLLDKIETTTRNSSEQIKNALAITSNIDPTTFGDNN